MHCILKLAKPDIGLFRCGRIKYPLPVWPYKLFEESGVAIELTKDVGLCVLALKVEHIHWEANVVKIMVSTGTQMLQELTVVVVEDVGGHRAWILFGKCSF